ncbi:aspartyl-phosphate phosphatase Spo0E family protein [Virgibacillus alimentarius]|uniref:Spo0E like sporulation regulatory protein n=1 Tax=Virgibacillus alimentarius TaxID=698769 RepID=A0ABS4S7V3_9BACI|nr:MULTISPECIES: aspartyl-phosphate phosphatase Spo0E family protein [Virgibacillus]MBP2257578.1 hypothetical protein [Virgibacillus alimentarius]HLR68928.1 aspartyl-phosphate phosphatase Spo0E family protein [Virgibacillus sp.]
MRKNSGLLKEIEHCREEMISLSNIHPLTSDIVVKISMRLDDLINEYQNEICINK